MLSQARRQNHAFRALILSLVVHSTFFVSVILFGTGAMVIVVKPVQPERVAELAMSGGSHRIRIVLPTEQMSAHVKKPDANADSSKKTIIPMQVPPVEKSGGGSPRDPHHGDGSGKALAGNGSDNFDMTPAFPVYSPHLPIKDRSLLPATEEKIVVDVTVDDVGQVVKETLVKGIGNPLDQMALNVVKTWRFQPAKINGKPVASEAEVIFPLNRNYPIADS
jgi:TonB family protein